MKISSEYDVVVLGAGAGGMTAACVAAAEGLRVVLIEKSPFVGGTTAVSGGMVWIPANAKAIQAGMADTTERARLYFEQTVRGSFNENARCAFLRTGEDSRIVPRCAPDSYQTAPERSPRRAQAIPGMASNSHVWPAVESGIEIQRMPFGPQSRNSSVGMARKAYSPTP
jgi:glycine/D-amino acid oxidase-like deaminating enzyme